MSSHDLMSSLLEWASSVRLLTLSLLYFVQGAPYGFQTACLPIILREAGLSFTALGAMKLLFLPWVCKPLYAPLIERTKTKDWWLTAAMAALCATCLAAAAWSSPQQVWTLSALMLALNIFSAAQDVATDSLAVRVLGPHELGVGNTIQVVAYKAGSVFAGGMLLWFRDLAGWQMMFLAFASLYLTAVVLFRRYRLADAAIKDSNHKDSHSELEEEKFSWKQVISVPGTAYLLFFVSFYKLCERAEQTFSLYLVDKGVPSSQLAFWSTIVRTASLLGSAYGGKLLSLKNEDKQKVGETSRAILVKYSLLRAAPIAAQLGVMTMWGEKKASESAFDTVYSWDSALMYLGFSCTSVALFCAGVVTTSAFTLMMKLSQKAPKGSQGTHYTLLATFEVLGKLAFASISGWMIDKVGLQPCFMGFVMLALLSVPASHLIPKAVTEERKNS